MSPKFAEENLIRSYLLGELPEKEQDDFEKRLLNDPKFFEMSLLIESELLDDYVMGSLSKSDRISLESGLLMSAQQQRRVQLIRLLCLKSHSLMSAADKRSPGFLSLVTPYFKSHGSGLAQKVWWAGA